MSSDARVCVGCGTSDNPDGWVRVTGTRLTDNASYAIDICSTCLCDRAIMEGIATRYVVGPDGDRQQHISSAGHGH